jgi:four helix bundle protein
MSSAANIVEGSARRSRADDVRFLETARSPASEVEYLSSPSRRLGFLPAEAEERWRNCSSPTITALQGLITCLTL